MITRAANTGGAILFGHYVTATLTNITTSFTTAVTGDGGALTALDTLPTIGNMLGNPSITVSASTFSDCYAGGIKGGCLVFDVFANAPPMPLNLANINITNAFVVGGGGNTGGGAIAAGESAVAVQLTRLDDAAPATTHGSWMSRPPLQVTAAALGPTSASPTLRLGPTEGALHH